jgi:hypothetical protein
MKSSSLKDAQPIRDGYIRRGLKALDKTWTVGITHGNIDNGVSFG